MNRHRVITDEMTFRDMKRMDIIQNKEPIQELENDPSLIDLNTINKVYKDEKNIKNERKRLNKVKYMFIEYLDINYNKEFEF